MPRFAQALAALAILTLCSACSAHFRSQPRPAEVAHLDIVRKQEYILGTKATLKIFRAAARDLRSRGRPVSLSELAERFDRYVTLQVTPIVSDFEAENNLATRREIAKLQLLCGLTYSELAEERKARKLLAEMQQHFGGNPNFLGSPLDRGDIGVASLEEGLKMLEEKLAGKPSAAAAPARNADTAADLRKDDPWSRMFSTPFPRRSSAP